MTEQTINGKPLRHCEDKELVDALESDDRELIAAVKHEIGLRWQMRAGDPYIKDIFPL